MAGGVRLGRVASLTGMTDRHAGYLVTLDRNVREDDAADIVKALEMVKGVISVKPVVAGDPAQSAERERCDRQWRDALWQLAHDGPGRDGT